MRPRQVNAAPDPTSEHAAYTTSAEKEKQQVGDANISAGSGIRRGEYIMLFLVVLLAAFDEVHFGGFAGKYIHQEFFMDVHPPLAKLLLALVAWLRGFKGNFDFESIGNEYLTTPGEEQVPYVSMRLLCALFGLATVPLAYLTLRGLALRPASALLGMLFVTFENALTTQSRLILLDAPLVFFVALSLYTWVSFGNIDARAPFSRPWWAWLFFTGLSLGAVISVKWVGLFTIAAVGLGVVEQLWRHLGNVHTPVRVLVYHLLARALCLIVVPTIFYILTFAVHFAVLCKPGAGATFMSWPFRQTLEGNRSPDTYAEVLLGSKVRMQHYNTVGGYLHSHEHNYETGSGQQQITLYPFPDENNEWYIIRAPNEGEYDHDKDGHMIQPDDEVSRFFDEKVPLRNGATVRLIHAETDLRLHSHESHRPPVTEADYQYEVSGYGFPAQHFGGDANDDWIVEIVRQEHAIPAHTRDDQMIALRTIFRLRHENLHCYLYSHNVNLPEWGFGQQEVMCNSAPRLPNSLWYIETNEHPLLELEARPKMIRYVLPTFFQKFAELQRVMWSVNERLTEHHVYESRPFSWPALKRGINFWTKNHRQVYLFGNPMVWWLGTASVLFYATIRVFLLLRAQRGCNDFSHTLVVYYDRVCAFLAIAWALHYLPFWLMKRQLFLHHYLPALYISILLTAAVFDLATNRVRPRMRMQIALGVSLLAAFVFWRYSPLIYASRWTGDGCQNSILVDSWDFNCVDFPDDVREYSEYESVVNLPEGHASDWYNKLPSVLRNIARPAPNAAVRKPKSVTGAPKPFAPLSESTATAASNATMRAAPNLAGLDQAQRKEAMLQGTSGFAQARNVSSSVSGAQSTSAA
ncbi:hypothetical protein MVES_002028 [Malassezia vespertilionis]|uniref:Dolichyl-phosphate-mannose--protein mannosyltransferase n=1 Tax=Malassezia vespertilionis TaxID=2020962 RepID=A0A2N1JC21_9BASI|nr:hypothetical protein MVES_002028 [Malassezia vespertilionis]